MKKETSIYKGYERMFERDEDIFTTLKKAEGYITGFKNEQLPSQINPEITGLANILQDLCLGLSNGKPLWKKQEMCTECLNSIDRFCIILNGHNTGLYEQHSRSLSELTTAIVFYKVTKLN